jgi:hypothetical protein
MLTGDAIYSGRTEVSPSNCALLDMFAFSGRKFDGTPIEFCSLIVVFGFSYFAPSYRYAPEVTVFFSSLVLETRQAHSVDDLLSHECSGWLSSIQGRVSYGPNIRCPSTACKSRRVYRELRFRLGGWGNLKSSTGTVL